MSSCANIGGGKTQHIFLILRIHVCVCMLNTFTNINFVPRISAKITFFDTVHLRHVLAFFVIYGILCGIHSTFYKSSLLYMHQTRKLMHFFDVLTSVHTALCTCATYILHSFTTAVNMKCFVLNSFSTLFERCVYAFLHECLLKISALKLNKTEKGRK